MGLWSRLRSRSAPGKLTTPDGLQAVEYPASWTSVVSLYGLRGSHGALYRSQPNVRAVVDFIAREAASLKLKVYEKVPSSPQLPEGRLELPDHPLATILGRPSPGVTRYRLWKATVADINIYDVAYWQKIRLRGQVKAVLRVPPHALTAERDPRSQRITGYRTSSSEHISLDNLVVFAGYDPEIYDGHVSPLETLRRILAEESAAGQNREGTWRNASRKSGIARRPLEAPQWSSEAREAWRADWESVMSGWTNAGRVGLLEDGMEWVEGAWSPEEMEYLGARKLTREECSAAFGIDPRLVFALDQPATAEVRTGFYVDRLEPLLTSMAEEVDLQLLQEFEPFDSKNRVYTEFNLNRKLRGSFLERARFLSAALGQPWLTPNEARAFENLPATPDGDVLAIPLNTVRGGGPQANPQSPVATPGDAPAPGESPGDGVTRGRRSDKAVETSPKPTAPEAALRRRREAAADYEQILVKHFRRQGRSISSLVGAVRKSAKADIDMVWIDGPRWDTELAEDLLKLSTKVVDDNARRAARQRRQPEDSYEPAQTRNYLETRTRIAAEKINAQTRDDVAAALDGKDAADVAAVFLAAAEGRAGLLALGLGTQMINFGRHEGAKQSGAGTKTWIVTSAKSRHPELNGQQTPIGDTFSNGLRWPGDALGSADEVASCQCLVDFG